MAACNEHDSWQPTDSSSEAFLQSESLQNIVVENGYLVFADFEHLSAARHALSAKSRIELDTWEATIPSFLSLRQFNRTMCDTYEKLNSRADEYAFWNKYDGLATFDEDSILRPKLDMNSLSTVLNEVGIFKVGNMVYKFNADGTLLNVSENAFINTDVLTNIRVADSTKGIYISHYHTRAYAQTGSSRSDDENRYCYRPSTSLNDEIARKRNKTRVIITDIEVFMAGGYHRRVYDTEVQVEALYRGKNFWGTKVWKHYDTMLKWEGQWIIVSNPINIYSYVSNYWVSNVQSGDHVYTWLMQDDWNSDDWPISTPIPPLTLMLGGIAGQPNNGTYIKGSMWDKTPCCGLSQGWLECVLN